MPEAFRAFALDTPQTARTLHAKLAKECSSQATELGDGYAKDWGDYRERVGRIDGLKLAMHMCEGAAKEEER